MIEENKKLKLKNFKNDLNDFEFNKILKHLNEKKKKKEITKEEEKFLKDIFKLKNELKIIELKNGLNVSHSILSHSTTYLKYKEELKLDDLLFLNELKKF